MTTPALRIARTDALEGTWRQSCVTPEALSYDTVVTFAGGAFEYTVSVHGQRPDDGVTRISSAGSYVLARGDGGIHALDLLVTRRFGATWSCEVSEPFHTTVALDGDRLRFAAHEDATRDGTSPETRLTALRDSDQFELMRRP